MIAGNLSGLTIILLLVKQSITKLLWVSKMLTKSNAMLAQTLKVPSSAKLWRIAIVIKNNKSFIAKLKRSGPRIEPCVTPEMIFSKELYVLLMRARSLQQGDLNPQPLSLQINAQPFSQTCQFD